MTSNIPESTEPSVLEPRKKSGDAACEDSNSSSDPVSPNCLKWAENLEQLLNDPEGKNLFEYYLKQEDEVRFYMLQFWYACRGVAQQQDAEKVDQAIRVIFKSLFPKIQSGIKDEVRNSITNQMRTTKSRKVDPGSPLLTVSVYSDACKVVEKEMSDVMYPNFLNSDVYLNYVQRLQGDPCNIDSSSREAPALPEEQDELPINFSQPALPVVDEDRELMLDEYFVPKRRYSSSRSSVFGRSAPPYVNIRLPNSKSRLYNYSYTQTSELGSLSSGARTDSLNDLTIDDATMTKNPYVYQRQKQMQQERNIMRLNKDSGLLPIIPRSSNPQAWELAKPMEPKDFARELIEKLEKLKRRQDSFELMDRKLSTIESDKDISESSKYNLPVNMSKIDDDDQEILDKHVSRVWNDKTPKRSPALGTPVRPKSPDRKSWPVHSKGTSRSGPLSTHTGVIPMKPKTKELSSLYSLDSGNFTDQPEEYDYRHRHPKYRSVSEYGNSMSDHYSPAHHQRGNRNWATSRRTLTDSGFSDINSYASLPFYTDRFPCIKEEKESSGPSSSSSKHKARSMSCSSKMKTSGASLHTFVSDPKMPPFSYHNVNTDLNLDEAARRLSEGIEPKSCRSTASSHGSTASTKVCESIYRDAYSQSSSKTDHQRPSTLTRPNCKSGSEEPMRIKTSSGDDSVFTTVVYNFNDEEMPYLLKLPGSPITLKLFKEYMPKKGQYRYFFVTAYDELDEDLKDQPIQQEITDDNQILPLWKGKVKAKIKAIVK